MDSIHCHANWAKDLGGVSFPLLADFHPKGEVARAYGAYLEDAGITDRATVVIDAGGTVRHASSVTPAGKRDIEELVRLCEEIDREYSIEAPRGSGCGVPDGGAKLFVKSSCGFSRRALLALENLHLTDRVEVCNVSEDARAREALVKLRGDDQAPVLVIGDEVVPESDAIVERLVRDVTGI